MKIQTNKLKLISLGSLCFILLVALSACHTADKGKRICCIPPKPPPSGRLTVYGKVHNIAVNDSGHKQFYEKNVLFEPHGYSLCSDSTDSTISVKKGNRLMPLKPSGKYSETISVTLIPKGYSKPSCLDAYVIALDTTRKHPIMYHFYRLLAGPKKISIDYDSFHGKPLHDSVRIDFTLPDSTGE